MAKKKAVPNLPEAVVTGLPQISVEIPPEIAQSKRFVQESLDLMQDIEALHSRIQGMENRLTVHKVNLLDAHSFAVGKLVDELDHLQRNLLRIDDLGLRTSQLCSYCTTTLGRAAYDKINA